MYGYTIGGLDGPALDAGVTTPPAPRTRMVLLRSQSLTPGLLSTAEPGVRSSHAVAGGSSHPPWRFTRPPASRMPRSATPAMRDAINLNVSSAPGSPGR